MHVRRLSILRAAVSILALGAAAACTGAQDAGEGEGDQDLTSISARQRALTFEGVVYVDAKTSDDSILNTIHDQTRTAFGPLLHAEVAAQTREMKAATNLRKRTVTVMDAPGANGHAMVEVRYTYQDMAVVPLKMAEKTSLSLAVLGQGAFAKQKEVVELCTTNDKEAREDADAGLLWYDFDANKASCRKAMEKEGKTIDTDVKNLGDIDESTIPASKVNRVYLPVTMQLGRAQNSDKPTFPEYDRLFEGPSEPGVLTLVLISGRLEHKKVEARKDGGFFEYLATLEQIFAKHPEFQLTKIEPETNLDTISAEGKKFTNLTFTDFINWTVHNSGFPEGMPPSSRDNIKKTIGRKLDNHWVTFEKKTTVQIGSEAPKPLTIRIETLFGADEDPAPHIRAMKRGDVFVYNGHSYIGGGPLDPANFPGKDAFTKGYQLLWFDSCVSWNYYEKDFFTQKEGGSKNLELITNGIEAPEFQSGEAEGKLIAKLLDGSAPSYQDLLKAAKATDSLRVVDGEIDNKYNPAQKPIRFITK